MLKLELSIEDVNKILDHLRRGQWEAVNDLIVKIKTQGIAQLEQKEPETKGE